jgi:hypothetical protein
LWGRPSPEAAAQALAVAAGGGGAGALAALEAAEAVMDAAEAGQKRKAPLGE